MGFINKFLSGLKDSEHDQDIIEPKDADSFIKAAENAAEIVSNGVKSKDFASMNKELENLPFQANDRTKYVFPGESIVIHFMALILLFICTIAFLYLGVIGLGVTAFSSTYSLQGILELAGSIIVLLINVVLAKLVIRRIRFDLRYDKYYDVLKYRQFELIEDLSILSGVEDKALIADLNRAIKEKWIPQGHFGNNDLFFIVSDDAYRTYKKKQATYDHYFQNQLDERRRAQNRSVSIQKILDDGQQHVEKIHDINDIIKDRAISHELDKMERTVSMIFHEVDVNPRQANKLGLFLRYYLPTTEKLLEVYIEISENPLNRPTLARMKKEIEGSLKTINTAFENLLDKFYQDQEVDIVSEISALEIMMRQEN